MHKRAIINNSDNKYGIPANNSIPYKFYYQKKDPSAHKCYYADETGSSETDLAQSGINLCFKPLPENTPKIHLIYTNEDDSITIMFDKSVSSLDYELRFSVLDETQYKKFDCTTVESYSTQNGFICFVIVHPSLKYLHIPIEENDPNNGRSIFEIVLLPV